MWASSLPPYQAHTQSLCLPLGERVFPLPGLGLQDSDTDHSDACWPVGRVAAAWRVGEEAGGEEGGRRGGGGTGEGEEGERREVGETGGGEEGERREGGGRGGGEARKERD